jgi:hypothetical protein
MITDPSVDATVHQAFARHNQSDWLKSLKLLSRAQAIMWNEMPIGAKQKYMARAEAEFQRHQMKETK